MKMSLPAPAGVGLLTLVVAMALVLGCETQKASEGITISPEAASIRYGDTVTFTASGGYDYRWSFADGNTESGTLSAFTGPSVVYRSMTSNGLVRTLTVTSSIESFTAVGGTSSTNTTSSGPFTHTAQAVITHLAPEPDPTPAAPNVIITPSEITLGAGASQRFRANGGSQFSWSLSDESIGTLSTRLGRETVYTVLTAGSATNIIVQTLTVEDETGATFSALIKHN